MDLDVFIQFFSCQNKNNVFLVVNIDWVHYLQFPNFSTFQSFKAWINLFPHSPNWHKLILHALSFLSTNISHLQSEMLHLLLVFFSWVFIYRRFHLFGQPLVLSVLSCSIVCTTHTKKMHVKLKLTHSLLEILPKNMFWG